MKRHMKRCWDAMGRDLTSKYAKQTEYVLAPNNSVKSRDDLRNVIVRNDVTTRSFNHNDQGKAQF